MSNGILSGKRGVIFGAMDEQSIAWHVAQHCRKEGAQLVLTNTPAAIAIGNIQQLGTETESEVVPCDATSTDDIRHLLDTAMQRLGGPLDFILHSVAQSQNLRRHRRYEDLNYNYLQKTLDISAISLHKILQTSMQMDALSEGASVVTISYLASSRYLEGYNDMSDAKALLESVVRNMGGIYGEKKQVRVNAISQSPVPTRAEKVYPEVEHFQEFADQMAPLGCANQSDCADLCVMLFSDYTRKVTMQTIHNDGGFSQTALSEKFRKWEYGRRPL